MIYLKSNFTSNRAKKTPENLIFQGIFCTILGTILRYNFKDVLSTPPPAATRSCQPPAHVFCLPSPLLLCHPPPNCPASCPPPPSSHQVVLRPIALLSSAPCPLASRRPPPPSHCVICRPPTFLFDCCVLDWWRRDVVTNPMSCVIRPSLSPCYPPPTCFASCSPATCLP
jgi:hypothetical protein